ncbi:MAG: hypothetical protein ABR575_00315, partial [Actinomycetota bacterium]
LERCRDASSASLRTAALREVIAYTNGYPYFLHEYGGKHVWNIAESDEITLEDVRRLRLAFGSSSTRTSLAFEWLGAHRLISAISPRLPS